MTVDPFASFIDYSQVIDSDVLTLSPMNPFLWARLLEHEEGFTVTEYLSHKQIEVEACFSTLTIRDMETAHCRNFAIRLTKEISVEGRVHSAGYSVGYLQLEHDGRVLRPYFWLKEPMSDVGFERKLMVMVLCIHREYFSQSELNINLAMRNNETALQLLIDLKGCISEYSTMDIETGEIELRTVRL